MLEHFCSQLNAYGEERARAATRIARDLFVASKRKGVKLLIGLENLCRAFCARIFIFFLWFSVSPIFRSDSTSEHENCEKDGKVVCKKAVKMKEVFARIKDQIYWNHHIYMLIESGTIFVRLQSGEQRRLWQGKWFGVAKMFKTELRKKVISNHMWPMNQSVGLDFIEQLRWWPWFLTFWSFKPVNRPWPWCLSIPYACDEQLVSYTTTLLVTQTLKKQRLHDTKKEWKKWHGLMQKCSHSNWIEMASARKMQRGSFIGDERKKGRMSGHARNQSDNVECNFSSSHA